MKKLMIGAAALALSAGIAIAQTPSGSTPAPGGGVNNNNPNAPSVGPTGSGSQGQVAPRRSQEPMSGNTGAAGRTGATTPPDPAGDPKKKGTAPANAPGN
ncbi:hypothetical protein GJW-30_1_03652 [Variibacter gotjawalensis]|uniref:Translation initiation factor IF-2 n=1 Tax=Variibacter gotjawalensis TaxID=1333996 RepID=A0A0S3PYT1_9BRAD|nr:hypothetical protein [Variibacter gotjawalensis]NIK46934.1 hypothetical protein [Variibacter gotjawalensis]RZS48838.1 hypothetical protein EV661_1259 [Variibacter gotjawalensis]BAT61097.1 hypothetical protein GJW-30_1_03652 [Variibacter gotjawalensis]